MVIDSSRLTGETGILKQHNSEQDEYANSNLKLQNEKTTILNQEELLEYLHSSKLDSVLLYNSVYEKNKTLFQNEEHLKFFNFFKQELELEIQETENIILNSQLELSEIYCANLIEEKIQTAMKKIETTTLDSVHDFIKILQNLFETYNKESRGRKKMSVFSKYMEKYWNDIINKYNTKAESLYKENFENFNEEITKSNSSMLILEKEVNQIEDIYNVKNNEFLEKKSELDILDKEAEFLQKQIMDLENEIEDKRRYSNNRK